MPSITKDDNLLRLAALRESLISLMNKETLAQLANLLDAIGSNPGSYVNQYKTWTESNGPDCRYAVMAKNFFLKNDAENIAKLICSLYHDWAKCYEGVNK